MITNKLRGTIMTALYDLVNDLVYLCPPLKEGFMLISRKLECLSKFRRTVRSLQCVLFSQPAA